MRLIMNDVTRCAGDDSSLTCAACARRIQMMLDDANGWYSYMARLPDADGRCAAQITLKDGVLREQAEQHMHSLRAAGL